MNTLEKRQEKKFSFLIMGYLFIYLFILLVLEGSGRGLQDGKKVFWTSWYWE